MNPDWPIFKSALMILALGAALFLSGCQFQPKPVSAISYSDDKDVIVQVTLRAADAQTIKTRELYFSLKVINCDGPANGFPAAPFSIAGKPAKGFDFPVLGDTVEIASRVPAYIFAQYSEPCVFLQVKRIFEILEGRQEALESLRTDGCTMEISCFWESDGQGGPWLDLPTIDSLARLRLEIWWDIYFVREEPSGDA